MRARVDEIWLVLLWTALALSAALLGLLHTPLGVLFGLPLVLVLPGLALTGALFPDRRLGIPERALLAFGASLALTAFAGFVLNLTPWGLVPESWALALAILTVSLSAVALLRRRAPALTATASPRLGFELRYAPLLFLAGLIALMAVQVGRISAQSVDTANTFTQLWILPENGRNDTAQVGIRSMEGEVADYRLELQVDGHVIQQWPSIELYSGGLWQTEVTLPVKANKIEAVLYRSAMPQVVYRQAFFRPATVSR